MPRKQSYIDADPVEKEKTERAARKKLRTSWRTGATEREKETSLQLAINKMGGGKKYSWLDEGPKTVAETLGEKRARELEIMTGPIAKELKIGEHRDPNAPQNFATPYYEDLRNFGVAMTRQEYEDSLRDSGLPENEIRIAMGPKPTKIIGRSAKEVRVQSGVVESVEAPAAPPKNPRGRKRATGTPADNGAAPAKKRRANAKGKGKAIVPAASLPTPSLSPPFASGMSPASAIDVDDDNYVAPGSTRAAAIDLDSDDDTPLFAPRSPSIDELEMALMEEQASALPKAPTLSSMSPAAEASTTDDAPPSPTLSQLEAALLEEESALAEAATEAPDSLTSSGADDVVDSHDDAPAVAPESPSIAELEEALLEELFLEAVEFVSDEEGDV